MSRTDALAPSDAPKRVLVLDDDRFMLGVLEELLGEVGRYHVATEADARDALARLGEHRPDVMICDLVLPDMDGIEFLQAAVGQGFRGKVVLLTGYAELCEPASGLARALGLQVAGAFRKPIGAEQLRRAVEC